MNDLNYFNRERGESELNGAPFEYLTALRTIDGEQMNSLNVVNLKLKNAKGRNSPS